jgi:hypothetical protein
VAPRYGGPGTGLAGTVTILRALGRGDPSVALIAAMTMFTHAVQATDGSWPEPLYAQVLAEAAQRPVLVNALRVEPELGTRPAAACPPPPRAATATGGR